MEASLNAPNVPSETGSATPSVSGGGIAPTSGRGRRSSATNRAVAAVQDTFPLPVNPSPLIRPRSPNKVSSVPVVKRFRHGTGPSKQDDAKIIALRKELQEVQPKAQPVNHVKCLPDSLLRLTFSFIGNTLSSQNDVAMTCRAWYQATFPMIDTITLHPDEAPLEALSKVGSIASLTSSLKVSTRGQHITHFTVVHSRAVYGLSNETKGPEIPANALSGLLLNMPALVSLDVRGIVLRDFVPWRDHFLADIHQSCPKLQKLRVGAQFLRNWEPQWWSQMTSLKEFVVGSRREDVDWHDSSPLNLPDDFFAMLRSPNHTWDVVKIWCHLTPTSFSNLVLPQAAFPNLHHLTVNGIGNTDVKPLDDPTKDEAAVPEKKKADPKGNKKGQEDAALSSKYAYPTLKAFVIADLKERPELASELLSRFAVSAPQLKHFTVVNTHRNAPGRIVAAPPKPTRAKPAAAAPQ